MKKQKLLMGILLITALLALLSVSLAEQARVMTPGGALNIRKTPDEKGKLVDSVPNKSLVEVEETGEIWSKITYKKKTGYVKTEYLRLPENMLGKTVYPDGGTLLMYAEPSEDAALSLVLSPMQGVRVTVVADGWAHVYYGEESGYAKTERFSYQYEEPGDGLSWISESATVVNACELKKTADSGSAALKNLNAGEQVLVTVIDKEQCLVRAGDAWGYAPKNALSLSGPGDKADVAGSLTPSEAAQKAEAALKKKYKAFAKEKLYCALAASDEKDGASGPFYHCGFYDDQDQYLYGALVDAEKGDVVFLAHYDGFLPPVKASALLPEGEMEIVFSADTLAIGDVLDITVNAWTSHESKYILSRNGQRIIETEIGGHFTAAYRPREAGSYKLTVTVKDENGLSATQEKEFLVDGTLPVKSGIASIYSQKDGWWADKQYRHSNLQKSGCAIFTLSHALQRMGVTDESTLPENLAVKYAFCLIKGEGTSNELLINSAAKAYGFSTRGALYVEKKQILDLLSKGALFSFSIVRGHIAMVCGVSEDGTMMKVVDSAPSATFERIVNASQYYRLRSGMFRAALTLDDLPGARWFFETDEYGGLEYWLPTEYVVKRGVRLIMPGGE
ncbi:MAG: SH3 domain-containing protein [Clostridia bacterium]|nr:SH3 domain-containing protein [Clostridia bacterium]